MNSPFDEKPKEEVLEFKIPAPLPPIHINIKDPKAPNNRKGFWKMMGRRGKHE